MSRKHWKIAEQDAGVEIAIDSRLDGFRRDMEKRTAVTVLVLVRAAFHAASNQDGSSLHKAVTGLCDELLTDANRNKIHRVLTAIYRKGEIAGVAILSLDSLDVSSHMTTYDKIVYIRHNKFLSAAFCSDKIWSTFPSAF